MNHDHEQGILLRCAAGHEQRLYLPDYDVARAQRLAGLFDGTSPLFFLSPQHNPIPASLLERCEVCGAWLTCTLFGYAASQETTFDRLTQCLHDHRAALTEDDAYACLKALDVLQGLMVQEIRHLAENLALVENENHAAPAAHQEGATLP